jgi:uncharacterized OsmC-like protein
VSIGDAVARATEYLSAHPDEARYRDAAATARIRSGLRAEVTNPGGEAVATDMPAGIGGAASAPSPGWLMRAAAASCVASLIAIRAASTGVSHGAIEVSVDSQSDDRGILGLEEAVPAGPLSVAVLVSADGIDRQVLGPLVDWALRHCPVTDAIARSDPISVELR